MDIMTEPPGGCTSTRRPDGPPVQLRSLLALAIHHRAQFATLDARISPDLIPGGESAYQVIS
jgi:hypothetical protein